MKDHVRIVVCGERTFVDEFSEWTSVHMERNFVLNMFLFVTVVAGVGKTSLIKTLISETFDEKVRDVASEYSLLGDGF